MSIGGMSSGGHYTWLFKGKVMLAKHQCGATHVQKNGLQAYLGNFLK